MSSVTKYTKKPVTIEAIIWTGDNLFDVAAFEYGAKPALDCDAARGKWEDYKAYVNTYGLSIKTLEGTMRVALGDYIIKGVKGEFYPCKPDIFEMTYEVASV